MRDMQGASDTPVRMTCRACVHNIVHAIVSAKLQTIIIIAKRTKHGVFCSFERIFQGQKHKIGRFCAFDLKKALQKNKNRRFCSFGRYLMNPEGDFS